MATLEVQVQQDRHADHDPAVHQQVGPAADAQRMRDGVGLVGKPHEVVARDRSHHRHDPDERRAAQLRARVDDDEQQRGTEDRLGAHRYNRLRNRSNKTRSPLASPWPLRREYSV